MASQVFVTGGVVSSLGKGITTASLARLLGGRGLRVAVQKLDPYLNVDPGTLNPAERDEPDTIITSADMATLGHAVVSTISIHLAGRH